MADYVVRLTGKDDLSGTIKQVKKELSDIGTVGKTSLEKIDTKFNRIIGSTAPLKRKLKDLQQIMADMNMKGLAKTDEFTKIAVEAGKMKDAMDDAAQAVRNYSNDTMGLQASIQMLQGVAAAGSVAAGTMALFGTENESVAAAIKKTQGALAVLNGLQSLANSLNKDSVLVLKLKQIQAAFNQKTTIANNIATATNTTVTAANTVATTANTAAQKAQNISVAIGKALFGDFSGLILVGAAALTTYSLVTSKSKNKQDELNDSVNKGSEAQKTYADTMANTYANLMSKYTMLRAEYTKLTTQQQKLDWIKNKKTALDELHLSIDGVTSADKAFINNTTSVVNAFMQRAEAAARAAQLTALYQKKFELQQKQQNLQTTIQGNFSEVRRINKQRQEKGTYTWGEAQTLKENRKNEEELKETNSSLLDINLQIKKGAERFAELNSAMSGTTGGSGGGGGTVSTKGTSTTSVANLITYAAGSLSDLEHQLSELQQKLKDGLIPADQVEETKIKIEDLKDEIMKKKILLGLEIDPNIKNAEEARQHILKQVEEFFANSSTPQRKVSSFDTAVGNNPFDESTMSGIENLMDWNDSLIEKLQETRTTLESLKTALVEAGLEGSEAFQKVNDRINSVDGSLVKVSTQQEVLSEKAKSAQEAERKHEETVKTYDEISDAANNAANTISSLANATDDTTFKTAAIIAEAIANIIAGYASASSQAASLGPWGWAAFSLAGLAQVASVISQIHSLSGYADGGIIGGGSTHGDTILSRLNAGEMVLNPRQQSNLFKAIDSGDFGFDNQSEAPTVQFKIKGNDLYGVLKNFSKTAAKSGKITGIK